MCDKLHNEAPKIFVENPSKTRRKPEVGKKIFGENLRGKKLSSTKTLLFFVFPTKNFFDEENFRRKILAPKTIIEKLIYVLADPKTECVGN